MKMRASERGAALLAVLAMIVLLASFASIGLSRLKAATGRLSDAEARAEAALLADSGVAAARFAVSRIKAQARMNPAAAQQPIGVPFAGGEVLLRFADGGNCFNLNSLSRPPQRTGEVGAAPQSKVEDFARLLEAGGVPQMEAGNLARATAAHLAQTGLLWTDGSEWATIQGVTRAHWDAVGRFLCALPNREATAINVNSLTTNDAPLLTAMGMGADEARRALASRPANGWTSASAFWEQAAPGGAPDGAGAQAAGTSSRWMKLEVVAQTPGARVRREILLDTVRQPARIASAKWGVVEYGPFAQKLLEVKA